MLQKHNRDESKGPWTRDVFLTGTSAGLRVCDVVTEFRTEKNAIRRQSLQKTKSRKESLQEQNKGRASGGQGRLRYIALMLG